MPAERPSQERLLTPKEYGQRVLALQDLTWNLLRENPMYQQALHARFQNAGIPGNQKPTPNEISFMSSDYSRQIRIENGVIQHPEGVATRTLFVEVTEKGPTLKYTDQYTFALRAQAHTDGELDRSSFGANNVFGGTALEHFLDLEEGAWGTDLEPVTDSQHDKFKTLLTELLTDPSSEQLTPEQLQIETWNLQEKLIAGLITKKDLAVHEATTLFGKPTPVQGDNNYQQALYRVGDTEYAIDSRLVDFYTPGHDDEVTHAERRIRISITSRDGYQITDHSQVTLVSRYGLREGNVADMHSGHFEVQGKDSAAIFDNPQAFSQIQTLLEPLLIKPTK